MASRCMQVVRQFSSSAVRAKLVQPPIQVFGTEGRYATALYSAASKQGSLDKVEYLTDPSQGRTQKKAAVEKLMKQKKFSDLTVNLFSALAENGRVNKTLGVLGAFEKIMAAHRGEVTASVVTAKPLTSGELSELKAALNGFLKKGESLMLTTEVDPR